MKASELMAPTLREISADAETISQQLLLRGGFVRRTMSGVYSYLPLGWRVIRKIEAIVREEMDRAGGQEIMLPVLQPAEIWRETGRWDVYGEEMFRLKDRRDRDLCLGPTHEELITDLARREIKSYRQLPLMLYQIQTKFRDELRPRAGLIRGREFIMKDLYSFDRDAAGLEQSYQKMFEAYQRIFSRCGLTFRVVEADPGAIGGHRSHEVVALADSGEAEVAYCDHCSYAANLETAVSLATPKAGPETGAGQAMQLVPTPGVKSIEEVSNFLGIPPERTIKTLLFLADGEPVAALVRGDRHVSEFKLQRLLAATALTMVPDQVAESLAGTKPGYVGPVGLKGIKVVVDEEVPGLSQVVVGANREGYHLANVDPGRDFVWDQTADIRVVQAEDPCPHCGHPLATVRGIEVGHLFQLGTKYSIALGAVYTDESGREQLLVMGSYGIGIGRTMAAIVEQHHDANGIIWPANLAPYQVVVITANQRTLAQAEIAKAIYSRLHKLGWDVVWDDRDERAGIKFADADLLGYPIRVTVGRKVEQGQVDVKLRRGGTETSWPWESAVNYIDGLLHDSVAALDG